MKGYNREVWYGFGKKCFLLLSSLTCYTPYKTHKEIFMENHHATTDNLISENLPFQAQGVKYKLSSSTQHLGTKFLGLILGMVLGFIYTIMKFFSPAFDPMVDIPQIIYVWVIFVFVIPLIIFVAEIFWRFFHKYSEKFPVS